MVYTLLDLETEGFSKDFDNILTCGFIRFNSQMEILGSGCYYFYQPHFNPGKYPACTVHKLSRAIMEPHEGEFKDNLKRLYSLCYNSTIVGKNSTGFDMPFIKTFLRRQSSSLSDLKFFRTLDVQDLVSPIYRTRTGTTTKKGTLTQYVDMYGITTDDMNKVYQSLPVKDGANMHMHGALYDCVATYLVLKQYVKETGFQL